MRTSRPRGRVLGAIVVIGVIAAALSAPSAGARQAGSGVSWRAHRGWRLEQRGTMVRAFRTTARDGGGVIATSLRRPAGAWFVSGEIWGTAGRAVVVKANGISSAPLRLDGSRQRFGISGAAKTAGRIRLVVETLGRWRTGNRVVLADVEAAASGPTKTFVGPGRTVMAEPAGGTAEAFTAKGYTYTSLEVGGQPLYWPGLQDPGNCQRDARLLAGAGVNMLRALMGAIERIDVPALRGCLDAFHANGIAIAWLEQGLTEASTVVDHDVWIELWKQKLTPAIDTVSGHPATYFWFIGNEVEIQSPGAAGAWYGADGGRVGLFDSLAVHVKGRDPNHLVGTTVAGTNFSLIQNSNLPHLELWAFNMYPRPGQSLAAVASGMNNADPRPKLVTEIGTDRLRCLRGVDSQISQALTEAINATPAWRTYACAAGSGDDRAAHTVQGSWNASVWDELANYLATSSNTQGAWIGALYFMSTDWWWFNILTNGFGTMHTHETQGFAFQMADNNFNPEFAGSMYAQLPEAQDMKMTSIALEMMGAKWLATPPPAVGSPAVSVSGCTATVTWTTSEPAATELLSGIDLADPALTVDNTLFEQSSYTATQATSHSATFAMTPGLPYRLAGRSFTTDGRHATTGPPLRAGLYRIAMDDPYTIPFITSLERDVAIHDLALDGAIVLDGTFTPAGPRVILEVQSAFSFLGCSRAALLLYVGQPDESGSNLHDTGGKPLPGAQVYSVASIDGESAWASTSSRKVVIDVDPGKDVTWQIYAAIIGGGATVDVRAPEHIAITPDGTKAFVTSPSVGTVTPIVLGRPGYSYHHDLRVLDVPETPLALDGAPTFVSADDAHVVVSRVDASIVTILSATSNAVMRDVAIDAPLGSAITPDGRYAVVGTGAGRVVRVALTDGTTSDLDVGGSIRGVGVLPDGTSAFAADAASGTVYRIDIEAMTVDAKVAVGDTPHVVRVAPDGQVWVMCRPEAPAVGRLKRIDPTTNTVDVDDALPFPGSRDFAIVPVEGQTSDLVRTAWCVFDEGRYAEWYIGGPYAGQVHSFHSGSMHPGQDAAGGIAVSDYGEIWVTQPELDSVWKWLGGRFVIRADPSAQFMDLFWGEYLDVLVYGASAQ